MCRKIPYDEKFWKVFEFWSDLNKALLLYPSSEVLPNLLMQNGVKFS
jgi:hypothetical protein